MQKQTRYVIGNEFKNAFYGKVYDIDLGFYIPSAVGSIFNATEFTRKKDAQKELKIYKKNHKHCPYNTVYKVIFTVEIVE